MGNLFSIPGAAIVALIVLLSAWLEQYFGGELWVAGVLGGLTLIAKSVELFWPSPPPSTNERMMAAQPDTVGRKVLRVLLG